MILYYGWTDHNPGPSRRSPTDRNIFSCFDDDSGDEDFNLPNIDEEIVSSDDESSDSDGDEETTGTGTDDRGWTEIEMPEPDVDNTKTPNILLSVISVILCNK